MSRHDNSPSGLLRASDAHFGIYGLLLARFRYSCLVLFYWHTPNHSDRYQMKWTDRIGRRVKLRDLHIVLAVAEAGSMTRAAEELAVSYPVVSKTISELEHTLGVKLFDRSISGVEPTHYGRALLKSGAAVFDEMRKGLQQIEFIKQPDAGDLRIGSSIVVDAGLLPEVIERFSQDFPRAALHVLPENIATQQYDNLRHRNVEIVLGRIPVTMSEPDLVAETLFDEPMMVAA